jgi:AraC-like DNA-binding protein
MGVGHAASGGTARAGFGKWPLVPRIDRHRVWPAGALNVRPGGAPAVAARHPRLPVKAITIDELRALIQAEPPAGADVAAACDYDAVVLAGRCGCSLRWLERVFLEARRTPYQWLVEQRMLGDLEELHRLHFTGRLESIKRFAFERGYSNPSNFVRCFRRVFHTTPTAYLGEREAALRYLGIPLPTNRRPQHHLCPDRQ